MNFISTAVKYIHRAMENMKKRPVDSEEDPSILEQFFQRGMTPKDAIVMVVDLLMTGIDTVHNNKNITLKLSI